MSKLNKQYNLMFDVKEFAKDMSVYDLGVFIVPNLPVQFAGPSHGHNVVGGQNFNNMRTFVANCAEVERLGIDCDELGVKTSSLWYQVWIHGLGDDNLTDHGCRGTDLYEKFLKGNDAFMLRYDRFLPHCLPEEFLYNIEEGDEICTYITRYIDGVKTAAAKIRWTFKQMGHRYERSGDFGKVRESLMKRARNYRAA